MGLTTKQKEVYQYIADYWQENGLAPTQREIKDHFELKSFGSVQRYIKYLMDAGLLEGGDWNERRGLRPAEAADTVPQDSIHIPLIGQIAAGNPIEAIEQADETIAVPKSMLTGRGTFFALKVKGDSMIEAGILNQDLAIIRSCKEANKGAIIAAIVDGEATLKHFYPKGDKIELHPANSRMQPIIVAADKTCIAGVLVGLWRSYGQTR